MITFKKFVEDATGAHGEYANDIPEKTMVNYIIGIIFGGNRQEKNYDEVYSFIESDIFAPVYDKYYDAFVEKSAHGKSISLGKSVQLSTRAAQIIDDFKKDIPAMYKKWKANKE